jgi:hypothetical protein
MILAHHFVLFRANDFFNFQHIYKFMLSNVINQQLKPVIALQAQSLRCWLLIMLRKIVHYPFHALDITNH